MADPVLSIQTLGGFRISYRGSPAAVHSERVQAFLTYLLLRKGIPQSRGRLASLFWSDSSDAQARTNLRKLVLEVRRVLPEAGRCLLIEPATITWRDNAPCTPDVDEFRQTAAENSRASLERAVSCYTGDLLPGCYEDWVLSDRERLRSLYIDTLERLVAIVETEGPQTDAIKYARRLLDQDPLREETYRLLIRLHALVGDRAGAVRVYRQCEAVLRRELDVAPGAATRAVYEDLLRADARAPDEPTPAPLPSAHNLPRHLTSFVGRVQEIAEVTRLLAEARLLTLRGAAGCGKTRLAVRAAADLVSGYPDGVWLVELAAVSDPALVLRSVASALGVQEEPGQSLRDTLPAGLRTKRLLLLLDNCEHLLTACGELATRLLGACPGVRILATSRQALGVPGECVWRVPPLALPEPVQSPVAPQTLWAYDAVQLFVERAAAVQPTFRFEARNARAVVGICRRLDGLPLAIELAAARVQALTPEQIAVRLDDRFRLLAASGAAASSRHQTLKAALAWSHDLLSEQERRLLRRLAVFAGGWTIEAAEAVCAGSGLEPAEILDRLADLVGKSLVVVETQGGEARYRLLETIREFAWGALQEAAEAETFARRHRDWCLALAERADPHLAGPNQAAWLERLETEHANIRAALRWSLSSNEPDAALRIASALRYFWARRGHFTEGRDWLDSGLRATSAVPVALRMAALNTAGELAAYQGDFAVAQTLLEEGLALAREHGEEEQTVHALVFLGYTSAFQRQCERARALLEESLAISRRLGSTRSIAYSLAYLGITASQQGDYPKARVLQQQALVAFRELGDRALIAMTLHNLGHITSCQGEHAAARLIFEESLSFLRALQDRRGIIYAATNLGVVLVHEGDLAAARTLLHESLTILCDVREKRAVCRALEGCGILAAARGEFGRAARLLAAAEAIRDAIGMPRAANDCGHYEYDRYLASVRTAIGDAAFEAARTQGQAMTLDDAIEYALGGEAPSGARDAAPQPGGRGRRTLPGTPVAGGGATSMRPTAG